MTVATDVVGVTYSGNGATTDFSVPFPFLANAHIVVTRTLAAIETELTEGVDYTLTGAGSPSGTVSMLVAPALGTGLVVQRVVPFTQETVFTSQGTFSATLHERAFDKVTMLAQQLQHSQDDDIASVQTGLCAAPPAP
jgi:hypothetical protein